MQKLTLTLLFIINTLHVFSQNASITGKVNGIDSSTALQGITVSIENEQILTSSNSSGNYQLSAVKPGKHIVVFSGIGYSTLKYEMTLIANQQLQLNVFMTESIANLNEVVVMTNGYNGLKNIPGSVQYISPKEIEKFSYSDVNRTLRLAPGINIQEEDGYGLRPNIGLRGTGVERSSKITIMEDGVLIAPAPYADPAAYYFPTIGRMQSIEILKGSSQIQYGPFTTGGAINFISTPIPTTIAARVHVLAGNYGARNLHAYVGNEHKNVAYLVETYQYGATGFKTLDSGGPTGFDKTDYLAKLRLNTGPKAKIYQSLTLKAGQTDELSNETYLGLTAADFEANPYRRYAGSQVDQMNSQQQQYSVTHQIALNKNLTLTTVAYATYFKRNWYKLDKVADSTGTKYAIADILSTPENYNDAYAIITGSSSLLSNALYVKANNRKYNAQGAQTELRYTIQANKIKHDLSIGARIHSDEVDRFQWEDEYAMDNGIMELTKSGLPGTESNRIKSADAIAAYAQYQLTYNKWTFVPGFRFEHIELSEIDYGKTDPDRLGTDIIEGSNLADVFIPGIGVQYELNKSHQLFTGVHKGFSPPGTNDETVPEESINYELGIRVNRKSIAGQMTVFVNDYSNLLGSDLAAAGGDGSGDLFNAGKVLTKGVEFQATYDMFALNSNAIVSLPITLVYTYTDAQFENGFESTFSDWGTVESGDAFPYIANHQLTGIIGFAYKKMNANISGNYASTIRMAPGQGEIPDNELIEGRTIFDLSVQYQVHQYISLFASALNFTDAVYVAAGRPSGLRPGMPRTMNIGVKMNF